MTARRKHRPLLPHEELAAQQPLAKPQYQKCETCRHRLPHKPSGDRQCLCCDMNSGDTRYLKIRKVHPIRNRGYLDWLRTQRCSIFGMTNRRTGIPHVCWSPETYRMASKSDPAHTGKAYSGKLKRSDVPTEFSSGAFSLCRHAHREQEDNMDRFDNDYGINRHEIATNQYEQYENLKR